MGRFKPTMLALESAVYHALWRVLCAASTDETGLMASRRTLVLAPHPDDETLGCGALIRRIRDHGQEVRVVIVTDGGGSHDTIDMTPETLVRLRHQEAADACLHLAVPLAELVFYDYPDGGLDAALDHARSRIAEEIARFAPQQVLYPSKLDSHPDHRALARAVEDLAASGALPCPAYGYPVWFWKLKTWVRLPAMISGLLQIKLTRVSTRPGLEAKRLALAAHRSQFENLTGDPDWAFLDRNFSRHFLQPWELFFKLKAKRYGRR